MAQSLHIIINTNMYIKVCFEVFILNNIKVNHNSTYSFINRIITHGCSDKNCLIKIYGKFFGFFLFITLLVSKKFYVQNTDLFFYVANRIKNFEFLVNGKHKMCWHHHTFCHLFSFFWNFQYKLLMTSHIADMLKIMT